MIDNQIRHQILAAGKFAHIIPGTQSWIGLRVIDRIEACVGAVDRAVEGQQMRTPEQPPERSLEQVLERERTPGGLWAALARHADEPAEGIGDIWRGLEASFPLG